MILPTRRAVRLLAVIPVLSILAIVIDPWLWLLPALAMAGLLLAILIDMVLALPVRRLAAIVTPPRDLPVGELSAIQVDLLAESTASWHGGAIEIAATCDHDALLISPRVVHASVEPGVPSRLEFPLRPLRRGQAAINAVTLRWTGPWKLTARQSRRPIGKVLRVVPSLRAVRQTAIQLPWSELYGSKMQHLSGDGSEFDALRDYSSGMDRRGIDWKHSARHRRLLSKEFRAERNHHIVLAFDTGHLMREPLDGMPKLDHAINAGLAMGYAALQAGDRVGLFGFDERARRFNEPVGGAAQFQRLRLLASELDYSTAETNFTLGLTELLRRLNRRALIVVITDFVDTITAELMVENMARVASRHLVLFVALRDAELSETIARQPTSDATLARAIVAEDMRRDRLIVFERLRRLGVQCLETTYQRLSSDLIDRYLTIKRREMI